MDTSRIIPQLFPAGWTDDYQVFGIPFTEEVSIGFVAREDGRYSYVMQHDVDTPSDQLLTLALANLATLEEGVALKVARPPGATVVWIEAPDNFGAVRLLLPSVKEMLFQELGSDFLFTIPSRDLILCWTAAAPKALTDKHAHEALEDFQSEEYNLSPHVYRYTDLWPCPRYHVK